jgi:hypothetical protein
MRVYVRRLLAVTLLADSPDPDSGYESNNGTVAITRNAAIHCVRAFAAGVIWAGPLTTHERVYSGLINMGKIDDMLAADSMRSAERKMRFPL